ncbi:hypothetical protein ACL00X_11070 [Aeromonas diversa]|uniref:hypothetical protein n=1 Tax=Aeromonas diversa TaxID=502790 RepID=UPI0039A0CF83
MSALNGVTAAVTRYHLALDRREHGGVAASKLVNEVQDILGMPWIQGAALTELAKQGAADAPVC